MIYLILAILTSTLILVIFKILPRYQVHLPQAITFNYLTASILGYLSIAGDFQFAEIPSKPWFAFSFLIGIGLILGFSVFGLSVRKAGVALTSVASKMSVVIPVTLGFWLFGDDPNITRLGGIFIALAAFILSLYKGEKLSLAATAYLFPLLLFFINGINDSLFKIAEAHYIGADYVLFLATAFLVSLFLGIMFSLAPGKRREPLAIKNITAGFILGLLNWYSTLAVLKGLSAFDVSVFFPMYNVGVVSLASIIGATVFREKLSLLNRLGILLALIAIMVIALN